MKKALIVVDMQKGFLNEHTEKLVRTINHFLETKMDKFDYVWFSKFHNPDNSSFKKHINWKKMTREEEQEIVLEEGLLAKGKVFEKHVYTAYTDEILKELEKNGVEELYLCGIGSDSRVLKTALDFFERGIKVKVIRNLTASFDGERMYICGLSVIKKCIGKENVIWHQDLDF